MPSICWTCSLGLPKSGNALRVRLVRHSSLMSMDHRATHILRLVQSLNRSQKYSHSRKVLRLDKHPGLPAATQLTSLRGELSTALQPHVTHRGTPPIRRASFMRKEVSAGPMSFCPRPNCARKN